MTPIERGHEPGTPSVDWPTEEGPALRDARAAVDRAARDEADAASARERFRSEPVPAITPSDRVAPLLLPGEVVHAVRDTAVLSSPGADPSLGYGGTLYLTSQRLLLLGKVVMGVELTNIVETSMAGERLMLALDEGEGVTLDLDRPRLLRAELAAVLRGMR